MRKHSFWGAVKCNLFGFFVAANTRSVLCVDSVPQKGISDHYFRLKGLAMEPSGSCIRSHFRKPQALWSSSLHCARAARTPVQHVNKTKTNNTFNPASTKAAVLCNIATHFPLHPKINKPHGDLEILTENKGNTMFISVSLNTGWADGSLHTLSLCTANGSLTLLFTMGEVV